MPTISRPRAAMYLVVVLCVLVLGGRFVLGAQDRGASAAGETLTPLDPVPSSTGEAVAETDGGRPPTIERASLVVHVVGAVRRPGLYRLAEGSRIDDAIREAGGPTRRAQLASVNLAAPVSDGSQIVVPARGSAPPGAAGEGSVLPGAPAGPVRLNTATLEELDTLPGVGPVTAQRILDYRDEHGPFASVDELDAVPGIGPARLEQLRELVEP
jgi:competence protein ComEA